jgi:drug/metabolite transporter (DMT)-like permease
MWARLLLVAVPFLIWFAYRWWVKRQGRPLPPTPYVWLFLAGIALMAGSIFATALTEPDNRDQVYVPAEMGPNGKLVPGRFEDR